MTLDILKAFVEYIKLFMSFSNTYMHGLFWWLLTWQQCVTNVHFGNLGFFNFVAGGFTFLFLFNSINRNVLRTETYKTNYHLIMHSAL